MYIQCSYVVGKRVVGKKLTGLFQTRVHKILKHTGLLFFCGLHAACSNTAVQVEEIFPKPLINPLPAHIGIHYGPELSGFVHEEAIELNGKWQINIGPAQKSMFEQILSGMFSKTTNLPNYSTAGSEANSYSDLDAILVPEIQDFQFSTPAQTRTPFYEIWIKYQINLYTPSGEIITQWPLTAYGKANTDNYSFMERTREPAVQEATRIALRDAAAFFALRFKRDSDIQNWLLKIEGNKHES